MNRIISPLKRGMQGEAVVDLQNALQLCLDRGLVLADDEGARRELSGALERERNEQTYGGATLKLVSIFQDERGIQASGEVDESTAKALNELLPVPRRIEGQIILEQGLPAAQLTLRLYRLDFGGKATLLDEVRTLEDGQYAFAYDSQGTPASLELRALDDAGAEIPLSEPLNDRNVESRTGLNLVAPGRLRPLAAEYRRMSADLQAQIGEMVQLTSAHESEERQDLTVLNRATGWDARLIALAATTERLSADQEVQLPQEFLYGLLRAGLPSDKLTLAQVSPDTAEQALKAARDAGIVELNDEQIGELKSGFAAFATRVRMNVAAPGSRASYGQLLQASGLSPEAQGRFASTFVGHRGNGASLWAEAREAGLDEAQVSKLELQGKLAFLAGNSEGMVSRLMQKGIADPAQLVEHDLHEADSWADEVMAQAQIPLDRRGALTDADKNKLDAEIPTRYVGESVEDRLRSYARDMARKVSLSYPMQVVGRMIERNVIALPTARDDTVALLNSAAQQGFRLGETPVQAFLRSHPGVRAGMSEAQFQSAQHQIKTLQRVYQITPGHEAMPVLMALNVTSAYDVTAYSEPAFTALFDGKYFEVHGKDPAPGEAQLVYRKARQVSSVTYNLFAIAGKLASEPTVAGMSAPTAVRQDVREGLIKQFPSMESLFGSVDFCECEHCRSVLSPAAYLVDLLQFVDPEPEVWNNFLSQWKTTHGGQDYPHGKPYDALMARRPDLPHIPLTCENTHTALPYIDIVNEILEYYVANGKLEEEAAHDTGGATTEELLAQPQNVLREAYDKLRQAKYPLTLPFDLWTETVRQFCDYFEVPLARMMDVLRSGDALFAPEQAFDRYAVFMESLRLTPAELAIFVDPAPLDKWHELYGYTSPEEASTEAIDADTGQRIDLNAAKTLARRLGLGYQELAQVIQTGFVNPGLDRLGMLHKLGVGIQDARFYIQHKGLLAMDPETLSSEERAQRSEVDAFSQKLEQLATTFSIAPAQLEADVEAIPFGTILVLADSSAAGNFDLTSLRYADGSPADPIAFLRINLFVRLWRKLGWSIDETDRALQVFVPATTPFATEHLGRQPLKSALIYLAHLKTLDERLGAGKPDRMQLLALWSDLAVKGTMPLYVQLFRSVFRSDPAFDDPRGNYLSGPPLPLKQHVLAVQGALRLSPEEISHILEAEGLTLDTADLSLANISRLYRYGLLARGLKLSVRELIALKELSGLDPFTPLHPGPLEDTPNGVVPSIKAIELDHPFSQTLRFVEIVDEVRASGREVEELEYLLRHRVGDGPASRPDPGATLSLLKALAEGLPKAERLVLPFVLQALAAHANADLGLVTSLVTGRQPFADAGPLLDAFAAAGQRGVSADFFDSVDGSGARQSTAASLPTADTRLRPDLDENGHALNPPNSARFAAYLEVPSTAAYRIQIVLEKKDAFAELRFDHLPEPVFLQGAAATDNTVLGDPPTGPIELKSGVPYRFSLNLHQLNGGSAYLRVESAASPQDELGSLTLYPEHVFQSAERAALWLAKMLQLVQGLALSEREVNHLLAHGAVFDDRVPDSAAPPIELSQLPTRSGDDTPELARSLFRKYLRWAAYARLKRELAAGSDGLIEVFEAGEGSDPNRLQQKVYPLLARLTRRNVAVVSAAAQALMGSPATPLLDSERPIRRLWDALQLVERFGVPVASLIEWMRVLASGAASEPRFDVARDFKDAAKARLGLQAWQRTVQPIFDRLRQHQRDALVSHVMHQQHFASREQLYEHFLIDPGMEPVVQTSRIRLAIASLQLFIQRSLLNMESGVHPSVINSRHWEWMKRYRVWEANRKIFLFPENWLEPEFRDDKTELFSELEGTLLQGDVSGDLAEDAFFNYLKKLDGLARLEIVGMHIEDAPAGAATLHVIGRTYSKPYEHFYRRYARQMWSPWESVRIEVEGNHLAPVVWRDRLYLFWVTFMDKPTSAPRFGSSTQNQSLAQTTLSNVIRDVRAAGQTKQIEVQLHWSEYLAGAWGPAGASDFFPVTTVTQIPGHWERLRVGDTRPSTVDGYVWVEASERSAPLEVALNFDRNSVFVHVSKEAYEGGEERGVYVHLRGGGVNQAFYMPGRNAAPEAAVCGQRPANPLSSANRDMANRYAGDGALTVEFRRHISTEDGKAAVDTVQAAGILRRCGAYTVLPCNSAARPSSLDVDTDPVLQAAIERGFPEIASLMRPVFFQDRAHTFFVEPSVTERTVEEWQDWVAPTPQPEPGWRDPRWWRDMVMVAEIPRKVSPLPEPDYGSFGRGIDPRSRIKQEPRFDWLVNPATALEFDGVLIGPAGRAGLKILSAGNDPQGAVPVNVHPASGLASGSTLVLASRATSLEGEGLTPAAGGLNIVGAGGFSMALARNLDESVRIGFGSVADSRPQR